MKRFAEKLAFLINEEHIEIVTLAARLEVEPSVVEKFLTEEKMPTSKQSEVLDALVFKNSVRHCPPEALIRIIDAISASVEKPKW